MKSLEIETEFLGKKERVYYQTCTLYITNPKYFMKIYNLNEVEEVGLCLNGRAISIQDEENFEIESDKIIPIETAQEAVNIYKTALKVIDVEEVNRNKIWRQIWEKIKRDIIDFDKGNTILFWLIWLFSKKNLGYTVCLATLCLLSNLNLYEVTRMVKARMVGSQQQKLLESQVWQIGLEELIDNPVRREDLQLYMKIKDENALKFR